MSNPYAVAHARQARARRRAVGPWSLLADWGIVAAVAVALPFLSRSVFGSLTAATAPTHTADLVARLGLVLAAAMSLNSYSVVVRGPDRGVLDLHPLLPGPWFAARFVQLLREQLPWLVAACLLLVPAARLGVSPVLPVIALAGAWAAGIGVGVGVNLAAPALALDPQWGPYLDAIRGHNPRLQAALIWAPGAALGVSGTAALVGSTGLEPALRGVWASAPLLGVPWIAAAAGTWWGWHRVGTVERIPALLGEIDAAWSAVETPETRHAVPLDWVVRWAPASLQRDLLRELRHLGRTLKIWQSTGWALLLAAIAAGWAPAAAGGGPLPGVMLGAGALLGLAAVRAGAQDPPWLEQQLGLDVKRVLLARGIAVWLLVQPAVAGGLLAGLVRNGAWVIGVAAKAEILAFLLALLGAAAGHRWRARGWLGYVPAAALLWAVGGWS